MTAPTLTLSENQTWLELRATAVEDLRRRREAGASAALERALRQGLAADPDPRRAGFYEASLDGLRYYFCVVRSDKVFLLARWRDA